MPATPVDRWPHFEMVTFSAPTGIPFGWDQELVSKGVPKDLLGQYHAAHELTLLKVPNYGPLVCFSSAVHWALIRGLGSPIPSVYPGSASARECRYRPGFQDFAPLS
jgi:hypothetical protein